MTALGRNRSHGVTVTQKHKPPWSLLVVSVAAPVLTVLVVHFVMLELCFYFYFYIFFSKQQTKTAAVTGGNTHDWTRLCSTAVGPQWLLFLFCLFLLDFFHLLYFKPSSHWTCSWIKRTVAGTGSPAVSACLILASQLSKSKSPQLNHCVSRQRLSRLSTSVILLPIVS